jgi:hypothetical protein
MYRGMEIDMQKFLNFPIDEGEWLTSGSDRFISVPTDYEACCCGEGKIFAPLGN